MAARIDKNDITHNTTQQQNRPWRRRRRRETNNYVKSIPLNQGTILSGLFPCGAHFCG